MSGFPERDTGLPNSSLHQRSISSLSACPHSRGRSPPPSARACGTGGTIPPRSPPSPAVHCWPSTPRLRNSCHLQSELYYPPCCLSSVVCTPSAGRHQFLLIGLN